MTLAERFFKEELDQFENEDIREFCEELLETVPDYFWQTSASSTNKWHPDYTIGFMGLAKHVKGATRFLNHMLSIDCIKNQFTSRERDLLRTAIMNHDDEKLGRNGSQYTVFKHPLLIAERIREYKGYDWLPDDELDYIASACESHMGQWNTDKRSKDILPLPETKAQMIIHLADYLASRKDLTVSFEGTEVDTLMEEFRPTPNTYRMPFGKHKGELLSDIPDSYLNWLGEQQLSEPLKSLVDEALYPQLEFDF